MIVPQFESSQCDKYVSVEIRAPYSKFTEAEWETSEGQFLFHCYPYYLRLDFGFDFDDEHTQSSYDVDKGLYTFKLHKSLPGTQYNNVNWVNNVETCGDLKQGLIGEVTDESADVESDSDSDVDSSLETTQDDLNAYGFGNILTERLKALDDLIVGVFELSPNLSLEERTERCENLEMKRICENRSFLCEVLEDDDCLGNDALEQQCLAFDLKVEDVQLSVDHKTLLKDFKFRQFLLSKKQLRLCYLTLVDILLCWTYEVRVSNEEHHSESCWNLVRLSRCLSCFLDPPDLRTTVTSFSQRVLLYPLCRSLHVAKRCIADVAEILKTGAKDKILSILLDVYGLMNSNSGEAWYLVNELFIKNCISWFHLMADASVLRAVGHDLEHMKIQAKDLEMFRLCKSQMVLTEDEIVQKMDKLNVESTCEHDSNESDEKCVDKIVRCENPLLSLCKVSETDEIDSDDNE